MVCFLFSSAPGVTYWSGDDIIIGTIKIQCAFQSLRVSFGFLVSGISSSPDEYVDFR